MVPKLDTQAIIAAAAVVQGLAAVVIAVFAIKSSAAAQRQARETAKSVAATERTIAAGRRATELAQVPILEVERPTYCGEDPGRPVTEVKVSNPSAVAALAVWVGFIGETDPGVRESSERMRSDTLPVLMGGFHRFQVDSSRAMSHDSSTGVTTSGPYSNNWWVVTVECRGPLGTHVQQEYEWHANQPNQNADGVWRLGKLVVTTVEGEAILIETKRQL